MHSLHSRWRQLCQSSFFGRKLTRVPPILPLHGLSLPVLERVQTTDWTNATSLTDYETAPPALVVPTPTHLHGSTSTFSSVGQLRGGQNVRLGTQRLLGHLRRVVVPTYRLRLLQAHIGVSFPLSAAQLRHDATPFARNQVNRLASLFFLNQLSLSVCPSVARLVFFHSAFWFSCFFCAIWLWKFR